MNTLNEYGKDLNFKRDGTQYIRGLVSPELIDQLLTDLYIYQAANERVDPQ